MPKGIRKSYDAAFKLKVVLETYKGAKTLSQIASEYAVHATLIHKWRNVFKTEGPNIFQKEVDQEKIKLEALKDELYKQIGQLTVERDWLKKKSETFN
jgi:transposase-like protein